MTGFLLDTNVLSEPQRPRPAAAVLGWLDSVPSDELWTSTLVLGELHKGVNCSDAGTPSARRGWRTGSAASSTPMGTASCRSARASPSSGAG